MKTTVKQLKDSQVELAIEVPVEALDPYLKRAAEKLSKTMKIEGFRPGKAPVNIVEQKVGKSALWEEAVELAIPKFYTDAVVENKIEAIGQPHVVPQKVAPANSFIFKATVAVVPEFNLPELEKIKVEGKKISIDDKEVDEVLKDMQKRQATSKRADRPAKKGDRVEVDFTAKLAGVVIEGGQSKNHPVVIGEGGFVPGFEDQLIGLKEDEEKKFSLIFPKDYYKKDLANREVDFEVKVKSVQEVNLPKLDDDFAKSVGKFESLEDLKSKLKENIQKEKEEKEKQRFELAIVDKIIEAVEKEKPMELPEVLIASEQHKMMHEFEQTLAQQGMKLENYLDSIKKTAKDFEKDQRPQAVKRVKFGLVIRKVVQENDLKVEKKEVEDEMQKIKGVYEKMYKAQKADKSVIEGMMKQFESEEYKNYIEGMVLNRKVFEFLKSKVKAT